MTPHWLSCLIHSILSLVYSAWTTHSFFAGVFPTYILSLRQGKVSNHLVLYIHYFFWSLSVFLQFPFLSHWQLSNMLKLSFRKVLFSSHHYSNHLICLILPCEYESIEIINNVIDSHFWELKTSYSLHKMDWNHRYW